MRVPNDNPRLVINAYGDQIDESDDVFCGNRCGFKCRRAAYDRACREATLLIDRLGPKWRGEVWENCGWHFCATLDPGGANRLGSLCRVDVRIEGSSLKGNYSVTGYTAELRPAQGPPSQIFSDHDPQLSAANLTPLKRFSDPVTAVRSAITNALAIAANVEAAASAVCDALPENG